MKYQWNKLPVKVSCYYCPKGADRDWDCPYCNDTGEILRDWYYGMKGKVFRLSEAIVGRTGDLMPQGSLVKVVMCSRFGDVGITPDLTVDRGYVARVYPEILEPREINE